MHSRASWRYYVYRLAWERLDVSPGGGGGEREVWASLLLSRSPDFRKAEENGRMIYCFYYFKFLELLL